MTSPSVNTMRRAVLRSATRATRREASTRAAVSTTAWMGLDSGKSERILGYSPSTSTDVVRRPPEAKPTRSAVSPSRISRSPPEPRDLATSVSVRALMSSDVERDGSAGVQRISFIASR